MTLGEAMQRLSIGVLILGLFSAGLKRIRR